MLPWALLFPHTVCWWCLHCWPTWSDRSCSIWEAEAALEASHPVSSAAGRREMWLLFFCHWACCLNCAYIERSLSIHGASLRKVSWCPLSWTAQFTLDNISSMMRICWIYRKLKMYNFCCSVGGCTSKVYNTVWSAEHIYKQISNLYEHKCNCLQNSRNKKLLLPFANQFVNSQL